MTASGQRPDAHPDTWTAWGGVVRTRPGIGETTDCGPLPTRSDTVRTTLNNPRQGDADSVRTALPAMPSRKAGAAFAEALDLIARETRIPAGRPRR